MKQDDGLAAERRIATLHVWGLTAAVPAALAVGLWWPGCHPLGSWPGRAAAT
jgi:hypothetical protein